MKTVPTVRLADTPDAAALPDLPEDIQLAMTDIAGAARDGLMAMSVAAGLAVMQAMFEAEIAGVAGPKGKHDPGRAALRHGQGRGSVTLGGRRVAVDRPRARTVDGHEVPLTSYTQFASDDLLSQVVMEWSGCWPGCPPAGTPARVSRSARRWSSKRNRLAARRFRVGSCVRPRPRWAS